MPSLQALLLRTIREWCLHPHDSAPYQMTPSDNSPTAL
jgi:hypothetical protein